jgi:hypothetical protein
MGLQIKLYKSYFILQNYDYKNKAEPFQNTINSGVIERSQGVAKVLICNFWYFDIWSFRIKFELQL